MNEENDFGFSFVSPEDTVIDENVKALKIKDLIMPLLLNLKRNPEKDTIKRPNREEKINEFIKRMDDILNS